MASLRIPGGARGARLAEMLVQANPGSTWRPVGDGIEVEGERIAVERTLVEQAYWPGAAPDVRAARRILRHLVRADPRAVRERTEDRLVVADEVEAEQALLVRFPRRVKERLARSAEALEMSQNELVVRAVEDLLAFLAEFGGEESGAS